MDPFINITNVQPFACRIINNTCVLGEQVDLLLSLIAILYLAMMAYIFFESYYYIRIRRTKDSEEYEKMRKMRSGNNKRE